MPVASRNQRSRRLPSGADARELLQIEGDFASDARALLLWYRSQKRDLPWRLDRDPYRIWISEVMLQQTTVAAVVPHYLRFLEKFPNVQALASAPVEDVLKAWAGLGYYSRARNLHRSAQALAERGFPRTTAELIEMPGFGPYTARAVASLAFDERVGVLDGNVIRVLSRVFGLALAWWTPRERDRLQELADRLVPAEAPHDWNQATMELGATVCTSANPACLLCPWNRRCAARSENKQSLLPLRKPRRARETWVWRPRLFVRRREDSHRELALVQNRYAPFLKGHWILPGEAAKKAAAPKAFDFRGTVTHHDIFVQVEGEAPGSREGEGFGQDGASAPSEARWVPFEDLAKWAPASLIAKAVSVAERRREGSEP